MVLGLLTIVINDHYMFTEPKVTDSLVTETLVT
jgi:hypothetical protein